MLNSPGPSNVRNRRILVTGGAAKEVIDGVRHYANCSRPEDHGHRVAAALHSLGAEVTLLTTKTKLAPPAGIHTVSADAVTGLAPQSAADLLHAYYQLRSRSSFDIVLHLCVVPSLKASIPAAHKLKLKSGPSTQVIFEVEATADILSALEASNPGVVAGYTRSQEFQCNYLAFDWQAFIETALHAERLVTSSALQPRAGGLQDLKGKKIIVSSGPIPERISDCGDVITNFSSGLQGHEIAAALADRGAEVVLITGPVTLAHPAHSNITTRLVGHTSALLAACLAELPAHAYVGTAAVADFKATSVLSKLTPHGNCELVLERTCDVLSILGHLAYQRPRIVVGFAAETRELLSYGRDKLERKRADVIFANRVGVRNFPSTQNHVVQISRLETLDFGVQEKYVVGSRVADFIQLHLNAAC